jgi:hypothetical protein
VAQDQSFWLFLHIDLDRQPAAWRVKLHSTRNRSLFASFSSEKEDSSTFSEEKNPKDARFLFLVFEDTGLFA